MVTLFKILTLFLPLIPTVIDSYGNPLTIKHWFGIDSAALCVLAIIMAWVLKSSFSQKSHQLLVVFLWFISLIALLLSITLTVWAYLTEPNYVYSLFRLNYQRIFLFGLVTSLQLLILNYHYLIQRLGKLFPLIISLCLCGSIFVVSLFPFDVLITLGREDNLIEWLQFFALVGAVWFAGRLSFNAIHNKRQVLAIIFLTLTLSLVLVTGDEISWGQRLFGLATPTTLQQINQQGEITWHNLVQFSNLPTLAYIAVAAYGSLAWIVAQFLTVTPLKGKQRRTILQLTKYHWATYFVPEKYLIVFFLIPLLFNLRILMGSHTLGAWAEPVELLLYIGVAWWLRQTVKIKSK